MNGYGTIVRCIIISLTTVASAQATWAQYNPNIPQYTPNVPQYNPNMQQNNPNASQYNPNMPQNNPNPPQTSNSGPSICQQAYKMYNSTGCVGTQFDRSNQRCNAIRQDLDLCVKDYGWGVFRGE